jgi:hypothetical protein
VRRTGELELVEGLPLAGVEPELGQGFVQQLVEPASEAVDPVDDPFDLDVDARKDVLFEEAVYVVAFFSGLGQPEDCLAKVS